MNARVTKGFLDGSVSLSVQGNAGGYRQPDIKVSISVPLTIAEARALAADLEKFASAAETKVAVSAAKEESRRKWRDREVAAGRMKIMNASEFFRR